MASLSTYVPRDKFTRTTPAQVEVACYACGRALFLVPCIIRNTERHFCNRACRRIGLRTPLLDRLLAKIDKHPGVWFAGTECWRWTGHLSKEGYGRLNVGRDEGVDLAHRIVYRLLRGPLAPGMEVDHLCRNRWCCNPDHLEPVPHRVNALRGHAPTVLIHHTGRCARGHELTPENTYYRKDRPGAWNCRVCRRITRAAHDRKAVTGCGD